VVLRVLVSPRSPTTPESHRRPVGPVLRPSSAVIRPLVTASDAAGGPTSSLPISYRTPSAPTVPPAQTPCLKAPRHIVRPDQRTVGDSAAPASPRVLWRRGPELVVSGSEGMAALARSVSGNVRAGYRVQQVPHGICAAHELDFRKVVLSAAVHRLHRSAAGGRVSGGRAGAARSSPGNRFSTIDDRGGRRRRSFPNDPPRGRHPPPVP
jgi:hypothetical protein